MQIGPALNTEGEDISVLVNAAALANDVDPVALLALLKAESRLFPRAERWGSRTAEAKRYIEVMDRASLQMVIYNVWPDVSFGYSQRIVLYHNQGDHSDTVENCLAVRAYVFSHPEEDIAAAAARLADGIARSTDGSAMGGMVVYNAGSDRRNDPAWMASWAGNVASYLAALEWAEQYRVPA